MACAISQANRRLAVNLTERLQLMTAQILSRPRLSRIIDQMDLYIEESDTMLREQIIDLMRSRIRVEPVLPELEVSTSRRNANTEINRLRMMSAELEDEVTALRRRLQDSPKRVRTLEEEHPWIETLCAESTRGIEARYVTLTCLRSSRFTP